MFQGLQEHQLAGALEAMLFVTDEPVGTIALAEMLECEPGQVEAALVALREKLERDGSGIQLREVAGGWRLFTHPAFHELIEKYVLSWDTRKLSAAAMETLAIVAYTQPVTRAGVASVRGVNSDSPINSLVEKGLVREVGAADTPGNPTLYGTTRGFLEKFGLRSPADLPDLADFAPDEETRRLITERLSATREDVAVSDEQARGMARALMGEDAAEGDGEALLFDEEMYAGLDAAAASLTEALDVERAGAGEERPEDESAFGAAADVAGGEGLGTVAATIGGAAGELRAVSAGEAAGESRVVRAEEAAGESRAARPGEKSAEAMFAEAIASTLGVVDKIDLDSLTFETDDE
ncbi:SMC-Scp complex subunit ScpB [Adlercreutzia caecimuris]|uniref:SMC-Scp complex subunit ScpB n=1 Tax=Adlercreutzia caecimuris TaxID=671266 RepID=UPI001C3ECB8C|nr:SMC-Scp complex subunit ScpB [Adlercreutzia caecimuris]MCR2037511.1 SMC-Scp complex subunit ScpB [Adlercreutzia caecimuris]